MKKFMVILAVVAMVGAFAATSIAAEWSFYGSARMNTTYYDKSKETVTQGLEATDVPNPALFDDQDMTWTDQSNARFGAKVKASDAVSGRFEFQTGVAAVGLRLMYGVYSWGSGSLLVGQDYTPVDQILSSSIGALGYQITGAGYGAPDDGEGDALTIGTLYESRQPQIKLKFGDLQLAFIKMSTIAPEGQGLYTDVDTYLPKIEVSYTFKTDMFSLTPYGGYNAVDFTNPNTDDSETVTSYVYGVAGKVNFGPMFVKANVFGSQNSGNWAKYNARVNDNAVFDANGNVEDSTTYGGQIIAGFKLSDMFTFEAGYSADSNEVDVAGGTAKNKPTHWYVNATITLAPGVTITPEVGMFDFGDNERPTGDVDLGDCTYYGAKWQINF